MDLSSRLRTNLNLTPKFQEKSAGPLNFLTHESLIIVMLSIMIILLSVVNDEDAGYHSLKGARKKVKQSGKYLHSPIRTRESRLLAR